MDSAPGDALPEVGADADRRGAPVAARTTVCLRCKSLPAPGSKLRYCGRCETAAYCSKPCARADWNAHKHVCESLRDVHEKSLAAFLMQGGRAKDFNQRSYDIQSWFINVPGLTNEIELLAWNHRSNAPIISALASDIEVDGSTAQLQMIPRSFWDEDPRFLDNFTPEQREGIRMQFSESSFSSSTKYVCVLRYAQPGKPRSAFASTRDFRANGPVRAAMIVKALTAATKPEDLADALAWFENALPAQQAQAGLQFIRNRATLVHGCTMSQGSVPVPTRALNNEVAYMMMNALNIAFDICLTGLCGATHLNGRKGVIRGLDPVDKERWTARLDDGMCVSAKAANFVHVRRGEYRRRSP